MRLLRNPVAQFLALGVLALVGVVVATSAFAERAAEDEVLAEARQVTRVLARSVAEPDIPEKVLVLNEGALDQLDRLIRRRLLVGQVSRVNFWGPDGLLYTNHAEVALNRVVQMGPVREQLLREGGLADFPAAVAAPENAGWPTASEELVVSTRIRSPRGTPLVFDAYFALSDLEERRQSIYTRFRTITVTGLLILLALVLPLLLVLTRTVRRSAAERERLLEHAIDASDAERRRIARDLHDGVVQDLAGTAYVLSAAARDPDVADRPREALEDAGTSLRTSLTALRSLLAEIHPADLDPAGLAAALADLTAPCADAGITASVSVQGAETASDTAVRTVWRVAQEAVRNSVRHSGAGTLAVTVVGDGRVLRLEVVDDGHGFDPAAELGRDRFGLRGLRSLVTDAGGRFDVASSPGGGTRVVTEVPAR